MSCCDIVAAKFFGTSEQCIEFKAAVTFYTGIRRQSPDIRIIEFINDTFPETIPEIKDIEFHSEFICGAARVLGIVKTSAGTAVHGDILIGI